MTAKLDSDLDLIARFLARRDVDALELRHLGGPAEVLVLVGSSLLITAEVAAEALRNGSVENILVAGGVGHSTRFLRENVLLQADLKEVVVADRAESEILADVLIRRHGVAPERILIENRSTNCGANAWETKRVLREHGLSPASIAIVQDPTMQLRTHASFERAWRGGDAPRFVSYAPFVPRVVEGTIQPEGQWSFERFVSLVLGEIPRLRDDANGYGPRGRDFIERVDVPDDVEAAYSRLSEVFGSLTRAG